MKKKNNQSTTTTIYVKKRPSWNDRLKDIATTPTKRENHKRPVNPSEGETNLMERNLKKNNNNFLY